MNKALRPGLTAVTAALAVAAASPQTVATTQSTDASFSVGWHRFQAISATSPDHAFAVGYRGLEFRGRIKVWNGQAWNNARSTVGKDAELRAVDATSDADAWAVGGYSDNGSGTGTHALTMHWNGDRWRVVRGPQPSEQRLLFDVSMVGSDDAWAVGETQNAPTEGKTQTLVKHWNGREWAVVESPNPNASANTLRTVAAVGEDDVWAAGSASRDGHYLLLIHWDGQRWNEVAAPDAYLRDIAVISADDIWAVGDRGTNSGPATVTEHWDGATWSLVPSPNPRSLEGNILTSVTAVASDDVWAVGYGKDSLYYPTRTIIEHWDGQRWRLVESPNPGRRENGLLGVSADSTDDAWAVGTYGGYGHQTDKTTPLLLHWNGTAWTQAST